MSASQHHLAGRAVFVSVRSRYDAIRRQKTQNVELRRNIFRRMTDCEQTMDTITKTIMARQQQHVAALGGPVYGAQPTHSCQQSSWAEQVGQVQEMQARLQHLSEAFQRLRGTYMRLSVQDDTIDDVLRSCTEDLIRLTVRSLDADTRTHGG